MKGNFVAKHMHKYNRATVEVDRKKIAVDKDGRKDLLLRDYYEGTDLDDQSDSDDDRTVQDS